ncbi:unnamed protein product [Dibothriocephalus latus]|uniref:C2H2-type domain-containing protein n=1 Tax=Dibothriocephalus latus TaxID=60516 RepID=A0A3P7MGP9_DIBLA|nr:unnamed protein product [Dibothriocephalus latus]
MLGNLILKVSNLFRPMNFPLLSLLVLSVLGASESKHIVRKDLKHVTSVVATSTILGKPPSECAGYIEHFLRWHISVSGGKDMTWILHLNGTKACQICYHGQDGLFEDMEACMECHLPFADHLHHSSHCRQYLHVLIPDPKACKHCFVDAKHKVHTALCHVDTKVRTAMDRMHLHFGWHF